MEDSIERLKRTLYSRNENLVPKDTRNPVEPAPQPNVPTDFGPKPDFSLQPEEKKNNSFFHAFLLGSLGFFVLALGLAAFFILGGWNVISSNNVSISVTGPSSIASGAELDLDVVVGNQNRTDMQNVALYIDYPEGSQGIVASSTGPMLSHEKFDLGTIKTGQSADHTMRLLLFGGKDAVRTFNFRVEYSVAGSNAIFSKTSSYDAAISSSPLILNVSAPSQVDSGGTVTLSVDLTSNSAVLLQNTLLKIDYPYGFTYKTSDEKPISNTQQNSSVWALGDLKAGDKKTLTVSGTLVGQDLEERTFTVSAGTASGGTATFDTALAVEQATVGISKSAFNLSIAPDTSTAIGAGSLIPVKITWENTLPDKTINNHIETVLSGNFDPASVSASNGGFFRSLDNTILWDKNSDSDLAEIDPGNAGEADFSLSAMKQLPANPHIDIHTTITGDRSGSETGTLTSSQDVTVKISSAFSLTVEAVRSGGLPRANQQTAYTVAWTLTNTVNDVGNTVVTATLPSGVSWLGEVSPPGENVSFDPGSQTVTWNAGTVAAGSGFQYSPKSVSFQLGLTPSISQVGTTPNLMSNAQAVGTDTYTAASLQSVAQAVTTGQDRVSK